MKNALAYCGINKLATVKIFIVHAQGTVEIEFLAWGPFSIKAIPIQVSNSQNFFFSLSH
jgi:hypothetical protein